MHTPYMSSGIFQSTCIGRQSRKTILKKQVKILIERVNVATKAMDKDFERNVIDPFAYLFQTILFKLVNSLIIASKLHLSHTLLSGCPMETILLLVMIWGGFPIR